MFNYNPWILSSTDVSSYKIAMKNYLSVWLFSAFIYVLSLLLLPKQLCYFSFDNESVLLTHDKNAEDKERNLLLF